MSPAANLGRRLVPALLVRDMHETLEFYQRLGFEVTGVSPRHGAPDWAEVTRDGIVLQFHTEAPIGTPVAPVCSATFYVYPDSVAALASELEDKVEFAWGPQTLSYGMHEFAIRDPNGYFLAFAEPA